MDEKGLAEQKKMGEGPEALGGMRDAGVGFQKEQHVKGQEVRETREHLRN